MMYIGAMPEQDYRAAPGRNYSRIKWALESGTKYKNPPQPASKSVSIGKAVATFIESEDLFREKYVVYEQARRGKAWLEFEKNHAPAEVITASEMATVANIVCALEGNAEAAAIIQSAQREVAVFGNLEGQACKARIDMLASDGTIYDLKTCRSAKPSKWPAYAFGLGYDIQAAFYADLVHAVTGTYPNFAWIAVENGDSPDVQIMDASELFIDVGRGRYQRALELIATWEESGIYPGYELGRVTVEPPQWAEHWSPMESQVNAMLGV